MIVIKINHVKDMFSLRQVAQVHRYVVNYYFALGINLWVNGYIGYSNYHKSTEI